MAPGLAPRLPPASVRLSVFTPLTIDIDTTGFSAGPPLTEPPSLIFSTNEPLDEDSYARWEKQFRDEHTGTENAYKAAADRGRRRQAVLAEPAGPRLPGQPQVQHD